MASSPVRAGCSQRNAVCGATPEPYKSSRYMMPKIGRWPSSSIGGQSSAVRADGTLARGSRHG